MNVALMVLYLGSMSATSYRSVPAQTDSSPYYTANGEHVHPHGIAVSQDLLARNGGPFNWGDVVYVEDIGIKIVNDTMNIRHKNSIDLWVATHKEEKEFDRKFRGRKLKIWLVKGVPVNEKRRR